jgi:acyl-coenzyme A synthetase/AMP-(fatty) acid ligase
VLQGKELEGEAEGILTMKQAWPSTIRTVKGDHKRFEETYFAAFPVRISCPMRIKRLMTFSIGP